MTPSRAISARKPAARSSSASSERGAGLRDGGGDAAARRGDIEVAAALDPVLELIGAPAAEGEVGVAVDQTGNDQARRRHPRLSQRGVHSRASSLSGPTQRMVSPSQTSAASGIDGWHRHRLADSGRTGIGQGQPDDAGRRWSRTVHSASSTSVRCADHDPLIIGRSTPRSRAVSIAIS